MAKAKINKFSKGLTDVQKQVKVDTDKNTLLIYNGQAGTGKTSLAVNYAYEKLTEKDSGFDKIIITRATAMKKKHDLGYMPGSLEEKMGIWMAPIFDSIYKLEPKTATKDKVEELMKSGKIEIVPFAFMQGRTFNNAIIIADEYQNLDDDDLEGLITRLGRDSKMILCGDYRQTLIHNSGVESINKACEIFPEMKAFTFTENFRNPLVKKIIDYYEVKTGKRKEYTHIPTQLKQEEVALNIKDIIYSLDNPNNG